MYLNRESLSQILKSYQNQQFIAFLSSSKAKADSKVDVHPTPHNCGLVNDFHIGAQCTMDDQFIAMRFHMTDHGGPKVTAVLSLCPNSTMGCI